MTEPAVTYIRLTRPVLSNVLFAIVTLSILALWDVIDNHVLLFVLVYFPWIIYMIVERTPKKLYIMNDILYVGKQAIVYHDIKNLLITDKRIEITLKNSIWLTRLIYLNLTNTDDREEIIRYFQHWKTIELSYV